MQATAELLGVVLGIGVLTFLVYRLLKPWFR
jgi:hypothetical protein